MEIFYCHFCGYFAPALPSYISHLRLVHAEDPKFDVICGIDSCQLRLMAFTAFSSHIYRHHRAALGLEEPTTSVGSGNMSSTAVQQPGTSSFDDHETTRSNF